MAQIKVKEMEIGRVKKEGEEMERFYEMEVNKIKEVAKAEIQSLKI